MFLWVGGVGASAKALISPAEVAGQLLPKGYGIHTIDLNSD